MGTKIIILGTSQTMTSNTGQDWTCSLSPTFQILMKKVLMTSKTMTNKVIMGTKIIILGTSQTMTSNAGQDWTGSLSPKFQILISKY